jgi:chemotaxis protein CheD
MTVVGIGEYAISNELEDEIITHALGSCVALIIYNPKTKQTALAHIVLPKFNRKDELPYLKDKPAYYADIIVPKLMDYFLCNCCLQNKYLQIQLVGGADSLNKNDVFHVGSKNIEMVYNILKNYSQMPIKMDVGGNFSRTVKVNVKDGSVVVKSNKMII